MNTHVIASSDFNINASYGPADPSHKYRVASQLFQVQIAAETNHAIEAKYYVKAWVKDSVNGLTNDMAPCDTNILVATLTFNNLLPGNVYIQQGGREIRDPRYNWSPAFWLSYPAPGVPSLNAENNVTKQAFTMFANMFDRGTDMYVSDSNCLQSVGELGNLLQSANPNKIWQTIKLFDDKNSIRKRDRVFELFKLGSESGFARGRVNLNTAIMSVLGTVFTNCPLGYMGTNNITDVSGIMTLLRADSSRMYYDIGDMGNTNKAGFPYSGWKDVFPGSSDCLIESVISQTAELLTVRQNLFTIFLAANTSTAGMAGSGGKRMLSSAYAIAEVWRDPFPTYDMTGKRYHKCFVRQFRIIDE
jgi:hypothetical protein